MALTDAKIRNLRPSNSPVKITDGAGLYLEIRSSGKKLWRYRYRIGGRENVYAMGEYAQALPGETLQETALRKVAGRLSLSDARLERDRCRSLVKQGVHPAHRRQADRAAKGAENANTFKTVALEWIDQRAQRWSPVYLRQIRQYLELDAFPYIGSIPVRDITAAHLLEVLRRVERRSAPTVALLLRQSFSAIFRYAIATLRADSDPAAALQGAITRPKTKHRQPLSRSDIPRFVNALQSYGGYRTTVIALRLMLLTFVRTKELRGAQWAEIEFDRAEWRVPVTRMKMAAGVHIVPLSRQALELLRELHTLTAKGPLLFPSYRRPNAWMSATTLNRALERMGFCGKGTMGFSAHGFRATASTFLNESGYRSDVIERQLAHVERNQVRAAYNQAQYLAERRLVMQAWADAVDEMAKLPITARPVTPESDPAHQVRLSNDG